METIGTSRVPDVPGGYPLRIEEGCALRCAIPGIPDAGSFPDDMLRA